MDILSWLKLKKMTRKEFSKEIGITPDGLQNYLKGTRMPRGDICANIEIVTEGSVTCHDLVQWWKGKNGMD